MATEFGTQDQAQTEQSRSTDQVEQFFATGGRCRLLVDNPRGRVTVQGWERPEVYVHARKLAGSSSPARVHATRIEMHQQGDTVILRTVLDKQALFGEGVLWQHLAGSGMRVLEELLSNNVGPAEVDYDVYVPHTSELSLKGVSSDLSIEAVQGEVRAGTVSGQCSVARTSGELRLSTVSGVVAGRELAGRVEATSVSGSIRLAGTLSSLHASTISGAIELAGPLASGGDYELHTVSGSATLRLSRDTAATIRAQGVTVGVQSDLPVEALLNQRRPGARRWEGRLGSGDGASVVFHTVSGSLHLDALADAEEVGPSTALVAPHPAPKPPPPERPTTADGPAVEEAARMQVLKALDRGEVTVDEALRQLEMLRRSR